MSRKPTKINPIRAERLKKIIDCEKSRFDTQKKFGKEVDRSQQTLSKIINLKMPLTDETANDIIAKFPKYRIEWLLGYDDYMTEEEKRSAEIRGIASELSKKTSHAQLLEIGMESLLQYLEYTIDDHMDIGTKDIHKSMANSGVIIHRDGKSVFFNLTQYNKFKKEMCDYIEFRLQHMMG